jgi:site-specific recombinase XerD
MYCQRSYKLVMSKKCKQQKTESTARLSETQVQRLVAHVQEQASAARQSGGSRAIVDEIIMLALLHAGLRPQELCALRVADTPAHHGQPELRVQAGPAGAQRVVAVPQEMVATFQRFVRLHRSGAKPSERLLVSERGTPFSYMSLYSKVRRIGQEAGVAPLYPAMLRHAFVVRLYKKEQDLRLVQQQAGHTRIKSTARHIRPRRTRERCDACNRPVPPGRGERIDSGQFLCPNCLHELRHH